MVRQRTRRSVLLLAGLAVFSLLLSGCDSTDKKLYVYTAKWCGSCQKEKGAVSKWGRQQGVEVVWIDADKYPSSHKKAGVKVLPTYDYYQGGKRQWRAHTVRKFR